MFIHSVYTPPFSNKCSLCFKFMNSILLLTPILSVSSLFVCSLKRLGRGEIAEAMKIIRSILKSWSFLGNVFFIHLFLVICYQKQKRSIFSTSKHKKTLYIILENGRGGGCLVNAVGGVTNGDTKKNLFFIFWSRHLNFWP